MHHRPSPLLGVSGVKVNGIRVRVRVRVTIRSSKGLGLGLGLGKVGLPGEAAAQMIVACGSP